MIQQGSRDRGKLGQAARKALQWLTSLNNHTEVTIQAGTYKGKTAIIIAQYKDVSLIEFYTGERIYLENFRMVKNGISKVR
jgi:hypothetical protein